MRFRIASAVVLCLMIASPVAAEFYKYRDKNGAVHFTDNLADVPTDQRPAVKSYHSYDSPQTAAVAETQKAAQRAHQTEAQALEAERKRVDEKITNLRERQATLVEEFEVLNKEREALKALMEKAPPAAQVDKYQQRIADLKRRVDDYHRRRKDYEKDLLAHNAQIAAKGPGNQDGGEDPAEKSATQ